VQLTQPGSVFLQQLLRVGTAEALALHECSSCALDCTSWSLSGSPDTLRRPLGVLGPRTIVHAQPLQRDAGQMQRHQRHGSLHPAAFGRLEDGNPAFADQAMSSHRLVSTGRLFSLHTARVDHGLFEVKAGLCEALAQLLRWQEVAGGAARLRDMSGYQLSDDPRMSYFRANAQDPPAVRHPDLVDRDAYRALNVATGNRPRLRRRAVKAGRAPPPRLHYDAGIGQPADCTSLGSAWQPCPYRARGRASRICSARLVSTARTCSKLRTKRG